ncbi:hypothetical protein D3C75_936800 [compost metagenome]
MLAELENPFQRQLADCRLIEFHRTGVGLKKPQSAFLIHAQIHRHLSKHGFGCPFDLPGDQQGGHGHTLQNGRRPLRPEGAFQHAGRLFDAAAARHMGRYAPGSGQTRPDAGYRPGPLAVLLQQHAQIERAAVVCSKLNRLLHNIT